MLPAGEAGALTLSAKPKKQGVADWRGPLQFAVAAAVGAMGVLRRLQTPPLVRWLPEGSPGSGHLLDGSVERYFLQLERRAPQPQSPEVLRAVLTQEQPSTPEPQSPEVLRAGW